MIFRSIVARICATAASADLNSAAAWSYADCAVMPLASISFCRLSDGRLDLEELEPADDRQEGEHRQEHEQHSFFHRSSVYSRGVTLTGVERLRFREFQCCTAFGEVKANGRPGPMRLTSSFCELVTHYLPLSFDRSATQLK